MEQYDATVMLKRQLDPTRVEIGYRPPDQYETLTLKSAFVGAIGVLLCILEMGVGGLITRFGAGGIVYHASSEEAFIGALLMGAGLLLAAVGYGAGVRGVAKLRGRNDG